MTYITMTELPNHNSGQKPEEPPNPRRSLQDTSFGFSLPTRKLRELDFQFLAAEAENSTVRKRKHRRLHFVQLQRFEQIWVCKDLQSTFCKALKLERQRGGCGRSAAAPPSAALHPSTQPPPLPASGPSLHTSGEDEIKWEKILKRWKSYEKVIKGAKIGRDIAFQGPCSCCLSWSVASAWKGTEGAKCDKPRGPEAYLACSYCRYCNDCILEDRGSKSSHAVQSGIHHIPRTQT